jgi:hypothetical protein
MIDYVYYLVTKEKNVYYRSEPAFFCNNTLLFCNELKLLHKVLSRHLQNFVVRMWMEKMIKNSSFQVILVPVSERIRLSTYYLAVA